MQNNIMKNLVAVFIIPFIIVEFCFLVYSYCVYAQDINYLLDVKLNNKLLQARLVKVTERLDASLKIIRVETKEVTAYLCIDPRENRYKGITKSGSICRPSWSAAVHDIDIPMGSLVIIPSTGDVLEAQDTGNLIFRGNLDVAVASREEAVLRGRGNKTVIIITPRIYDLVKTYQKVALVN